MHKEEPTCVGLCTGICFCQCICNCTNNDGFQIIQLQI